MSRTQAKNRFTVDDQIRATAHVECRKDAAVIDEIPIATCLAMTLTSPISG
jgi:tRNA-splicing ligase RtcB